TGDTVEVWTVPCGAKAANATSFAVSATVRAGVAGVVALASADIAPPLGLLTDLVSIIGADAPQHDGLAVLGDHEGVR
ncbi:hypothetical protein K7G98_43375, partial [Saccharothrix sp. MB29]|nr:hypothetical protein [Saccharothrix sp. MB29]